MSTTATDPGYFAHSKVANENRAAKARTLALLAFRHGLTSDDVRAWDPARARAFARAAGVNPPSWFPGETWRTAVAALDAMNAQPDHPAAPARDLVDQAAQWRAVGGPGEDGSNPAGASPLDEGTGDKASAQLMALPATASPDVAPAGVDQDEPRRAEHWRVDPDDPPADPPPKGPRNARPLPDPEPLVEPLVIPRGWEALAALGPLTRPDARCHVCRAPAIKGCLDVWRCAAHPPQPGEWGAYLNWTPNERTGACYGTCYCGRCDHHRLAPPVLPPPPRKPSR